MRQRQAEAGPAEETGTAEKPGAAGGKAAAPAAEVRSAAAVMLAVADVLCSFESYHLLTSDQGLSGDDLRTALTSALTALLDRPAK